MKAKHIVLLFLLVTLSLSAYGQQRYCCTPNMPQVARTRGLLDYPNTDWDPNHIYRQPVILITFKDCDFSMPDPVDFYSRILNEPGYNEGVGLGCLADYFRDQSEGQFNLQFDIYGPVQVDTIARGNGKINYGEYVVRKAAEAVAQSGGDFSPYDWDGDGYVDQVIFIVAGYCGNQVRTGYIWPNTGIFYPTVNMPGRVAVNYYSVSCELWKDGTSCGIGTICHEFTHCLGLPDIYPTSSNAGFSVVDEWDIMDGGNYTNKGWCPPNYSTLEKMLMGWKSPVELTDEAVITDMKPVSEGGDTYIIRNPGCEDEFYLIENRQQSGWDYGCPGRGLLIFHVDYNREVWSNNNVNTSRYHYRYHIFNADGKVYSDWDPKEDGSDWGKYTMDNWMRNRYLSTSAFPYFNDGVVVDQLTDDSDPAATLFNSNIDGSKFMSKPITGIRMSDDGTVSFSFNTSTAIARPSASDGPKAVAYYDLNGRRLPSAPTCPGIYILRSPDGTTRKVIR
jgi:M6 family metalloprotease-like protein